MSCCLGRIAAPRMPLFRLSGNPSRVNVWALNRDWSFNIMGEIHASGEITSLLDSITHNVSRLNQSQHPQRIKKMDAGTRKRDVLKNVQALKSHLRVRRHQWCDRYWFLHVTWLIVIGKFEYAKVGILSLT